MIIVFEGPDGCGKSTQARALFESLEGIVRHVRLLIQPCVYSVGGALLREILAGKRSASPPSVALLFAANRWDQYESFIEEDQRRNPVHSAIICDRWWYSSLVYQVLAGVDEGFVRSINALPAPDLTFYLRPPNVQFLQERLKARGGPKENYENADDLAACMLRYDEIFASHRPEDLGFPEVVTLPAQLPKENLQAMVHTHVARAFSEVMVKQLNETLKL